MKCSQSCPTTIRIIAHVICLAALIIWSWIAIRKFIAQPIATYIHYTKGDDGVEIKFPHLTFCPQTEDRLSSYVEATLKDIEDPKFDMNKLYYLDNAKINKFVQEAVLLHNREHLNVNKSSFYPIFHSFYGPCITFDADQLNVNIENGISASVTELTMKLDLSVFDGNWIIATLHSKLDSADALDTNPMFGLKKGDPKITEITLNKKIISCEPTRQFPCDKYDLKTCNDVEGNRAIIEKLNCKLAILYSGRHLEQFIPGYENVPFCNDKVTKKGLKLYLAAYAKCKRAEPRACNSIKYSALKEEYEGNPDGTAMLVIRYSNFEVEHYTSYIGYDEQSLVAELGGLLGMTLGLSFVTIGDVLSDVTKKYIFH